MSLAIAITAALIVSAVLYASRRKPTAHTSVPLPMDRLATWAGKHYQLPAHMRNSPKPIKLPYLRKGDDQKQIRSRMKARHKRATVQPKVTPKLP